MFLLQRVAIKLHTKNARSHSHKVDMFGHILCKLILKYLKIAALVFRKAVLCNNCICHLNILFFPIPPPIYLFTSNGIVNQF